MRRSRNLPQNSPFSSKMGTCTETLEYYSHVIAFPCDTTDIMTIAVKPVLTRRTLQDNVYQYLKDQLRLGQIAPGERLTVRGVAAAIGTSAMPVREAFRRLTSEGALEPLSTGATGVPVLDAAQLGDLTGIRILMEGLAARRAATRITKDECAALERTNEMVRAAFRAGDVAAELRANEEFHFGIYRAAQSDELLRIIEHLWMRIGPCLLALLNNTRWSPMWRKRRTMNYHDALMRALRHHDPDGAEAALKGDLAHVAEFLVQQTQNLSSGTVGISNMARPSSPRTTKARPRPKRALTRKRAETTQVVRAE
jgi:DNA-binding GntR family transcriptional regulator